jgi:hypothetical protein
MHPFKKSLETFGLQLATFSIDSLVEVHFLVETVDVQKAGHVVEEDHKHLE